MSIGEHTCACVSIREHRPAHELVELLSTHAAMEADKLALSMRSNAGLVVHVGANDMEEEECFRHA